MFDSFVFVDESGDLGAKGTRFFVVAAVEVEDENEINRVIKRARARLLGKKSGQVPELKASRSPDVLRHYVLTGIAEIEHCRVHIVSIEKTTSGEDCPQDETYQAICAELCEKLTANAPRVVLDKRYTRRADRQRLETRLRQAFELLGKHASIEYAESFASAGLQAADFVAWAAFQKIAKNNSAYCALFERKIESQTQWKLNTLLQNWQRSR